MAKLITADDRARQRQNSLEEQLQQYRKTGRVTKGMERAGYVAVAPGSFVAGDGDSPFSVARQILGRSATESQVAAFVQTQGWSGGLTSGVTYKYRGAFLNPNARPSSAFMAQVSGSPVVAGTPSTTTTVPTQPAANQGSQQAPIAGSGVQSLPSAPGLPRINAPAAPTRPTVSVPPSAQGYVQPFANTVNPSRPAPQLPYGAPTATSGFVPRIVRTQQGTTSGVGSAGQPSATFVLNQPQQQQIPYGATVGDPRNRPQQFTPQQAETARLTGEAIVAGLTNPNLTGLPPVISSNVFDMLGLPPDIASIYQRQGGSMVLDPALTAAISGTTGGNSSIYVGGDNEYTGWLRSDAIGVSPYLRVRRGGSGAIGTTTMTPLDFDPLAGGLGLQASWRIGF